MFSCWEQAVITKLRGHEFGLGVVEVGEMSPCVTRLGFYKTPPDECVETIGLGLGGLGFVFLVLS